MKPRPGAAAGPSTAEDLARWDALRRVAIVGAGTLKGKELEETLDERKFPAIDVQLHQQTINLLSFQELPKAVFDAQVAFNMLSRYGAEAVRPLEGVEQRILRHLQAIAGAGAPVPSLMLLQGPTFHAYAFSVYIQFA